MATKKKAAAKKVPAKSVKTVAAKKVAKPATKVPAKKVAPKKAAVKVAKKAAPKKAVPAKKVAKPVVKKNTKPVKAVKVVKKEVKKEVKKVVAPKQTVKETAPVKKVAPAKKVVKESKSLVSIVKKAKPVTKKEAPKPARLAIPKLSTKNAVKYRPDFTKSVLDKPKIEKAQSVMRYSDSDLIEFKEIILRKLDAAKKELAYLQGLITRRDESGDLDEGRYMTMEDGSVSMEREQLSQLASRQITFIDHLEKALMRVENKTYGICRVTGNLIDKARLRAVPHATLSIEAKSMMNK